MAVNFSNKCRNHLWGFCVAIVACIACCSAVNAQTVTPAPAVNPIVDPLSEMSPSPSEETNDAILDLDIEKLGTVSAVVPTFDVEVSSVSKQESTVGKSPAAVYVITSEMIRRSGATCIPETLRLAPGVEVARASSSTWCISIRGYNDRYTNKLLVLIDGRSVYSPVMSGVFWDMLDMPLEDIERIEIIRGPGGTLWGANAVNGIINIISKKAKETQGVLVSTGGGSQDYNINTVRYGGQLGKNTKFRVWGKYRDEGPEDSPGKFDDWRTGRGGFYADWNPRGSRNDLVTVQGNFYSGNEGVSLTLLPPTPGPYQTFVTDRRVAENSLLARWNRTLDDESDWTLQSYFDQTCRDDPQGGLTVNTFDVDFQYRRPIGKRHSLITGVEYRQTHDFFTTTSASFMINPSSRSYNTISGFFQDEIEIVDDKFYLTFGSKFEGNSFTGFEYQPSIRGLWVLDNRHVFWGAISRAVRAPSRVDENVTNYTYIPGYPFPLYGRTEGSESVKSENIVAYELGYRTQASKRFAWDIALFYNRYQNLMGYAPGIPYDAGPYWVIPVNLHNCGHGDAYGFEWTVSWEATEKWKLAGSYSFLSIADQYFYPGATGPIAFSSGSTITDPRNQIRLQSYWNFAKNWQLDMFVRYVDELASSHVPSYITMDLRLGWQPNKNLDFSIVGQNLFSPHHLEFGSLEYYGEPNVEIDRAVFAKITWTR